MVKEDIMEIMMLAQMFVWRTDMDMEGRCRMAQNEQR